MLLPSDRLLVRETLGRRSREKRLFSSTGSATPASSWGSCSSWSRPGRHHSPGSKQRSTPGQSPRPWPSWLALLLFIGAAGKSAQIPLYVWLPDAMEGPTPVSALIHAATMVTAGVYLIARLNVLYAFAPAAGQVVAWVGALTAVYAGTIALVQNDIKRVLAYLHDFPTGIHVSRLRRRRLCGRRLPPLHPCVLQGPAVFSRRERYPCPLRGTRLTKNGRIEKTSSLDLSGFSCRSAGNRRRSVPFRIFLQGRHPGFGIRPRSLCPSGRSDWPERCSRPSICSGWSSWLSSEMNGWLPRRKPIISTNPLRL